MYKGPRHIDPSLVHEHLQVACDEPIKCRLAILVIAAAPTSLDPQMRVDVVGLERRQAGGENNGHKGSS
jgi:hypothetical protein